MSGREPGGTPEPAVVLVHSPLVGPSSWRAVEHEMRVVGRSVVLPSLVPALASAPPFYERLAGAVHAALREHPANAVILVVHSGAGALVPSIVNGSLRPVRAVIFVDAVLPHPGRSWIDSVPPEMVAAVRQLTQPDGFLPPWHAWFPPEVLRDLLPDADARAAFRADVPRLPLSYFEEVAPSLDAWRKVPCGYLRLSAAYDGVAADARGQGWPAAHHDGSHLDAVTKPAAVRDAVLELADLLEHGRPG